MNIEIGQEERGGRRYKPNSGKTGHQQKQTKEPTHAWRTKRPGADGRAGNRGHGMNSQRGDLTRAGRQAPVVGTRRWVDSETESSPV